MKHMLRETCASVVLFFLYCLGKIILDFRNVKQLKYPFFPFHIWSMSCTVVCSVIYGVSSTKSKTGFRKFSGCNTKFDHLIWIYGWESYQWLAQGACLCYNVLVKWNFIILSTYMSHKSKLELDMDLAMCTFSK